MGVWPKLTMWQLSGYFLWEGLWDDVKALPSCLVAHQRDLISASKIGFALALQTSPVLSCRSVERNVRGSVGEQQHC